MEGVSMKRSRRQTIARPAVRRHKVRTRVDRRRLEIAAFEQWQRARRPFGPSSTERLI
jgi:hypothetical protein